MLARNQYGTRLSWCVNKTLSDFQRRSLTRTIDGHAVNLNEHVRIDDGGSGGRSARTWQLLPADHLPTNTLQTHPRDREREREMRSKYDVEYCNAIWISWYPNSQQLRGRRRQGRFFGVDGNGEAGLAHHRRFQDVAAASVLSKLAVVQVHHEAGCLEIQRNWRRAKSEIKKEKEKKQKPNNKTLKRQIKKNADANTINKENSD